jgi:hypothetical protein
VTAEARGKKIVQKFSSERLVPVDILDRTFAFKPLVGPVIGLRLMAALAQLLGGRSARTNQTKGLVYVNGTTGE